MEKKKKITLLGFESMQQAPPAHEVNSLTTGPC